MATKEEPKLGENEILELTSAWQRNLLSLLVKLRINTTGLIKYLNMRGINTLEDFYAEKPSSMERFLSPVQYEKLKTEFEDYQMNFACKSIDFSSHKMSDSDCEKSTKAKPLPLEVPKRRIGKEDQLHVYDMKRDCEGSIGRAVIIVNKEFRGSAPREGADKDRDNLQQMFINLTVTYSVHENKTSEEMSSILKEFADSQTETSIVFVAISTHGGENNSIQGTDHVSINIDGIIDLFQKNEKLRGKPKIFLIQACRGTLVDFSTTHSSDCYESGTYESDAIPVEQTFASNTSDVLIAYATSNKHKAWRDKTNGSWFITELKKAFENFPGNHLTEILTICANNVIRNYQIMNSGQLATEACNFHSSLTKFVFF